MPCPPTLPPACAAFWAGVSLYVGFLIYLILTPEGAQQLAATISRNVSRLSLLGRGGGGGSDAALSHEEAAAAAVAAVDREQAAARSNGHKASPFVVPAEAADVPPEGVSSAHVS